jgi:hypothetical protein
MLVKARLHLFARRLAALTLVALTAAVCAPTVSQAARGKSTRSKSARNAQMPKTIGSRQLKPGMQGYGLTVMRGTKIERFSVKIIGVLHNKLPGQDMIMIRCSGLNLEHSGIVAGMSGSPIYVKTPDGDRLVGALSYGFPFNKDPVAGVTPIADMLPELDRPLIAPPRNQRILPPARARRASVNVPGYGNGQMRPVTVPLSVAGFHPDAVKMMTEDFAPLGWTPMQAGGGATGVNMKSPPLEPGSGISLSLVRGDMNVSGIGTVTWVRGNRYIAFGHPFKGLGQLHMPVGGAHIVWILSSTSMSFKMGMPLSEVGILDIDRQPAIAGRIGPRSVMVPMTVTVRRPRTKQTKVWNVEVVDEPYFFPLATGLVVGNALRVSEPIIQNASVKMTVRYELETPYKPIELEEYYSSLGGTSRMYAVRSLIQKLSKAVTYNGFKRLRVEKVRVELEISDDRPLAFIEAVHVPTEEVDVGEVVSLRIEMIRPNVGKTFVNLKLPPIPKELAGEKIRVWVGKEAARLREMPLPANITEYLRILRYYVPSNRLAAIMVMPDSSWMIRGERLTDLPIGVLDELSGHQRKIRRGKNTLRRTKDLPWVINGKATLTLKVRDPS